MFLLMKWNE